MSTRKASNKGTASAVPKRMLKVGICGNPNSGKTCIFNDITGSRQHVGNWPGVTVEKKEGRSRFKDYELDVIDLPGTYSLTAYSLEEIITRDYILHNDPDVVISVIDATNLERNLYLTVQILELGVPVIVALNMADMAKARGIRIDEIRLAQALQAPIVRTVASTGKGIDSLINAILETVLETKHVEPV